MKENETAHATVPVNLPRRYPPAPLVGVAAAVFNDVGAVLLVQRGRAPRAGSGVCPAASSTWANG